MAEQMNLYRGSILDLNLETRRLPDGRDAAFEIVRHPGGAAVLPVLDDRRLLLLRQFRPAADGWIVEIPAGRFDSDESPAGCARRELREEAGLEAGRLHDLGAFFSSPGFCDERIHLFVAERLRQTTCDREPDEFIETFAVPLDEALQMIDQGKIVDSKTQLAILRYARLSKGR